MSSTAHSVFEVGEKVHVITRRLFAEDVRRHFAGTVQAVAQREIRAEGYVFVFNAGSNQYERRTPRRVRVFSVSDGNIFNVIPTEVDIEQLQYQSVDSRLAVVDGRSFVLHINEFSATA